MDILSLKLDDLTPDPDNARAHDTRNLDAITNSLRRFGQQKPIVVNTENVGVAGNGTVSAALSLGWSSIDAVRTQLDGDEAALFAIADNRTSELASWNLPQLDLAMSDLKLDTIRDIGFTASELDALLSRTKLDDELADSQMIDEKWAVQVDCADEISQVEVMEYLEAGGFSCRALIS